MQREPDLSLGEFGDVRLDKRGRRFCGLWFARAASVCARWRTATGRVHGVLAVCEQSTSHDRRLIEGWSMQTATVVSGRHVLAIQDTSEIKFHTRRDVGAAWARSAKVMPAACCCMP